MSFAEDEEILQDFLVEAGILKKYYHPQKKHLNTKHFVQFLYYKIYQYFCSMKTEQDKLRADIKPFINSINGLAKQWGVDPIYFNRWYNGMPVGKKVLGLIKSGIKKLKK